MRKRVSPSRLIGAALIAMSVSLVVAHEPDGRVAFRYTWPEKTEATPDAPVLKLTITAVSPLKDAHLVATPPSGIGLTVRAPGRAALPWPRAGMDLGDLAAGQTVVVDLDLIKPAQGGGVMGFALEATSDGRKVREGVGVPVGAPGVEPTQRDGVIEFPAEQGAPAP